MKYSHLKKIYILSLTVAVAIAFASCSRALTKSDIQDNLEDA